MEKGILSVTHLVNSSGCIMSNENFCLRYDLIGNRNIFKSITKPILNSIIRLIKGILTNSTPITSCLPQPLEAVTLMRSKFKTKQ